MMYYLDTNIIIYALKGTYPAIKTHFEKIPAQSILIPSVVIAEIEYGAQKSRSYQQTIAKYRCFTNVFRQAEFDDAAALLYGQIRSHLEKKGMPIGSNDLMIAATVASRQGVLVTHNQKEFRRVPGLILDDWTE